MGFSPWNELVVSFWLCGNIYKNIRVDEFGVKREEHSSAGS